MSVLFGGKFKFSTIQAFFTFILPGWEPLDMKKLTNFDFIFVAGETAFENWISCLFKFKKSAKDFDMRVESDPESSSAFTESSLSP